MKDTLMEAVRRGELNTRHIASICRVSTQTVINWTDRDHTIHCLRLGRGPRRYNPKEVVRFLRSQKWPVPPELEAL